MGLGLNPSAGAATICLTSTLPSSESCSPSTYLLLWKLLLITEATRGRWAGRCSKPGCPGSSQGLSNWNQRKRLSPSPLMKLWNMRPGAIGGHCFLLSRKQQPKKMKMTPQERERWRRVLVSRGPEAGTPLSFPWFGYVSQAMVAHRFHFGPQLV